MSLNKSRQCVPLRVPLVSWIGRIPKAIKIMLFPEGRGMKPSSPMPPQAGDLKGENVLGRAVE